MSDGKKGWRVLSLGFTDREKAGQLASELAALLGRGVLEEDGGGKWWVRAYLAQGEEGLVAPLVQAARAVNPALELMEEWLEEKDWNREWKSHYRPVEVGDGMVVVPSWLDPSEFHRPVVIRIDPGQAFGTGTHPTTTMVMEAMERWFRGREEVSAVLDVGTGTGILAIAALLLGAERAVALDNDPLALEAAALNVKLNGVGDRVELSQTPLASLPGSYPLVVANLDAPTLLSLSHELAAKVRAGGVLIVSGILDEQEEAVVSRLVDTGLSVQETTSQGEWVAVVLERR